MRDFADGLKKRLDEVSWRGTHYQHMVPLQAAPIERDFGVDTTQQVSLHNAYLLNRGVTHEQACAIIKTYQRIRDDMPETSPGEFYLIYPPFERGWRWPKWNNMNGGVTTIVAGELARGALEHGFEDYGVDILKRMHSLAAKTGNRFPGCYKGAIVQAPERSFTKLDMRKLVNADFVGDRDDDGLGWTDEGENDLRNMPTGRQVFHDVPFDVIDPADNHRRACLGISRDEGFLGEAEMPVGQKAASVYLLHTKGGANLAGLLTLVYADGTQVVHYIADQRISGDGPAIGGWWFPSARDPIHGIPHLKVAWSGTNPVCNCVGVYAYGLDNPHPEKVIKSIRFNVPPGDAQCRWMILAATVSDAPVYFEPCIESGIPAQWGAGDMYYGLVEGLVGIQNQGVAFDKVRLVPRWEAAGKDEVHATFRYASSDGYVSYHYKRTEGQDRVEYSLTFTDSANETLVELLLPEDADIYSVKLNGQKQSVQSRTIESSRYAMIRVRGVAVHTILLHATNLAGQGDR